MSRFSLLSRAIDADDAWQLSSEGDDIKITPVAHPIGTSIEVRDLFFNTPVRRKFLKSNRTEYFHIEEVVKRRALSRFTCGFT